MTDMVKTKKRLTAGEAVRLIALGDSLTQGWMVRKGYLEFLAEMIGEKYPSADVTIINRGVPGDTAEGGLFRLRDEVLDCDPDAVFIQFALNDAFTGVTPARFKNTIRAIVEKVRSDTDAEILLVTSVPIVTHPAEDKMTGRFYDALADIAGEEGCAIAPVHRYWKKKIADGVDFSGLVQADEVHPTVEGYRLMAEAIMEAL